MSVARYVQLFFSLLATTVALGVAAQTARQDPVFVPARLWDGKTPDFRGIWQAHGTAS
jgi:hypothetical protein